MIKKINYILEILLVVTIFSLCLISSQERFSGTSTQVVTTQTFSRFPSNPYSSSYSGLYFQGVSERDDEGFFDLMMMIPPGGCKPGVVRSDLLEEQDVPVFCEVAAVKINPGVDITNVDRIFVSPRESNPYISAIGFYPSNAAVRSSRSLQGAPSNSNLGYLVVVLKRQETEQQMPEFISVNLSAYLQYGSRNSFGIGESEFYVPELNDLEFENNYKDYGFWDGRGYLRAERVRDDDATITIYTSENKRANSVTLKKGEPSKPIYIPHYSGSTKWGQGLEILLQDTTLPETKAKIEANGRTYEVYEGGTFENNKCTLLNLEAYGGGTGFAQVKCGGDTASIELNYANVKLEVNSKEQEFAINQKIISDEFNGYLVYLGTFNSGDKTNYIVLYNDSEGKAKTLEDIKKISKDLDSKLKNKNSIIEVNNSLGRDYIVIPESQELLGIKFVSLITENMEFNNQYSERYYGRADKAYDEVIQNFAKDIIELENQSYAEKSLWLKYQLAKKLNQEEDAKATLFKISENYPYSLDPDTRKTAQKLLENEKTINSEKSVYYFKDLDLVVNLLSVDDPSQEQASVVIDYSDKDGEREQKTITKQGFVVDKPIKGLENQIILKSFDKEKATFSYRCEQSGAAGITSIKEGEETIKLKETKDICDTILTIESINLKRSAKIKLTPITQGRSRESNLTFSIGIEKRAIQLSPDKALEKIKKLNETINKWEERQEKLGKLVEGMKKTCLATSATMTIKNLISGVNGEAAARTRVMSGTGGWNEKCAQESAETGKSVDQCLLEHNSEINQDVQRLSSVIKQQDTEIKSIDSKYSEGGLFGKSVDYNKARADYFQTLKNRYPNDNLIKRINLENGDASYQELRELDLYKRTLALNPSESLKELVENRLSSTENIITQRQSVTQQIDSSRNDFVTINPSNAIDVEYKGLTWHDWKDQVSNQDLLGGIQDSDKISLISYNGENYLYILAGSGISIGLRNSSSIYSLKEVSGKYNATLLTPSGNLPPIRFKEYDSLSYKNGCKNCDEARFFVTEPYKDMPALIPFDEQNGWYVATQQTLPVFGGISTYQESGRVNTFWVCNVDGNGLVEGVGLGDDICRRFDLTTGDTLDSFPGLDPKQSTVIVSKAIQALEDASRQYLEGRSSIIINGMNLKVRASEDVTGSKCTDFMSPRDCQIMFNACDPVVCPASRCDLGGTFRVDNVIQSGIVGSTFLCLPNIKEGVYIPVCLTGIHAGIESWVSIMKAHRDCLQESIETNRTIGICDEIYSVYQCDFFWKNMAPFANVLAKNLFISLIKGGTRGGGEYGLASQAFENAENSWKYFTTMYARDSKLAFGARSFAEVGSEVCKMKISATYPDDVSGIFEPESPPQIYAQFDEMPYTDATVPPVSQYKVYYHIYSGQDDGAYYSVYLKSQPTALGYTGTPYITVDSGYIVKGQTIDETKDFTATAGFKELCVRINAKDYCGFKSVTTDAGINYAKDQVLKDQSKQQITTEDACVSGEAHVGSMLNLNVQEGLQDTISPNQYNSGIIRICSSKNPGLGVEPARWQDVGYCGQESLRCWIDTQSVKDSIQGKGIETSTIQDINNMDKQGLVTEGYYDSNLVNKNLSNIESQVKDKLGNDFSKVDPNLEDSKKEAVKDFLNNFDNQINKLYQKTIFNKDKAEIKLYQAYVYSELALKLSQRKTITDIEGTSAVEGDTEVGSEGSGEKVVEKGTAVEETIEPEVLNLISEFNITPENPKLGEEVEINVKHSCASVRLGVSYRESGNLNSLPTSMILHSGELISFNVDSQGEYSIKLIFADTCKLNEGLKNPIIIRVDAEES